MTNISNEQARVLNYIYYHFREHGYAPSYREIAQACSIGSTSTVSHYLEQLHEAGLINRRSRLSRAISATPKGRLSAKDHNA